MSAIGPALPAHLQAKRKRRQEETAENEQSTASGAKPVSSPDAGEKRRRVIGPAMPPAPLDEKPSESPSADEAESEDDDDDFGPALPTAGSSKNRDANITESDDASIPVPDEAPAVKEKAQRDEWMTMPPEQDDLAARMDPSKIRARGFNTGRAARGGPGASGDGASTWHETPEQRRKRLEDEVMGVAAAPASQHQQKHMSKGTRGAEDEASAQRIREKTEKARGPSLLDRHKQRLPEAAEDDPSKRAFDREKDMGSGSITKSQKRELLNKASDYSSRFSGGSYL